jgi:DME family drug/metabolite transporter
MKKHILSILTAGCLWGLMGLFTRNMASLGFSSPGTLIIRCGIACISFGIMMLVCNPKLFRIKFKDIWCFLGAGLCSLLFFTYCYFQAISLMSLSAAAILLYTAPSIVMVMSLFIFKEKLTRVKIVALLLAFSPALGAGE